MPDPQTLDVLIRTGIANPLAIGLVESLFQEAGIAFFVMDQNVTAREEGGDYFGWCNATPEDRWPMADG